MKTKKFTFSGIFTVYCFKMQYARTRSLFSEIRTYGNNILLERQVKLTGRETPDGGWTGQGEWTTGSHHLWWCCSKRLGGTCRGTPGLRRRRERGRGLQGQARGLRWARGGGHLAADGAVLSRHHAVHQWEEEEEEEEGTLHLKPGVKNGRFGTTTHCIETPLTTG